SSRELKPKLSAIETSGSSQILASRPPPLTCTCGGSRGAPHWRKRSIAGLLGGTRPACCGPKRPATLIQLHPVVPPHVSHLRHVPLRTRVKLPHSPQASPS